jgi:hypothetical protein
VVSDASGLGEIDNSAASLNQVNIRAHFSAPIVV